MLKMTMVALCFGLMGSVSTAQADPSQSSVEFIVDGSIALSLGSRNIVQLDGNSEMGSIQLQLDEEFSQRFEEVTETSIGKTMTVTVCSQEVLTANVNSPTSEGVLLLSGLSEALVEELVQVLSGKQRCK